MNTLETPGCTYKTAISAGQAFAAAFTAAFSAKNIDLHFAVTTCKMNYLFYTSCYYYSYFGADPGPPPTNYLSSTVIPFAIGCPVPTVNPSVPYSPNSYDGLTVICTRPMQATLIISLTSSTEVEPSKGPDIKTLPFIATVKDQNTGQPPPSSVKVHISLKVDPISGGHDHGDSMRARGGIAELDNCDSDGECWSHATDGRGEVVFNFNSPEASGTHTITATCDGCSNNAVKNVDVKLDGLWPIPGSVYYTLIEDGSSKIIGSTTKHMSNHYLTSIASLKLWRLASNYYAFQIRNGVENPTLPHLNDASLKWGGVFDLDADWDEPHKEHRRGTVVDVRANSSPGAIPAADFNTFKQLARQQRIDPHFEGGSTNQHFHLRLLNRPE